MHTTARDDRVRVQGPSGSEPHRSSFPHPRPRRRCYHPRTQSCLSGPCWTGEGEEGCCRYPPDDQGWQDCWPRSPHRWSSQVGFIIVFATRADMLQAPERQLLQWEWRNLSAPMCPLQPSPRQRSSPSRCQRRKPLPKPSASRSASG